MRIYVGNLPYSTTDDDLRQAFEPHGDVHDASVVIDRVTGRSRGFGFIEMRNTNEGRSAIEAMNGAPLQGRSLRVNEAQPRNDRPRGGGGGRGGDNYGSRDY